MLSGPFVNWVTWPLSDVFSWTGYLLAFAVLAARHRRWRHVVALALAVAFSIYGGFPEANVMLVLGFGALALGAGAATLVSRRSLDWRAGMRPLGGALLGVALASPLWLPGLQVISLSHRSFDGSYVGLPMSATSLLLVQGYDGLPNGAAVSAYVHWPYYESVAYVGVIAAVMALVALLAAWRRPLVVGLGVALLLSLAASYEPRGFTFVFNLIDRIPELRSIRFERLRTMTAFLLALLGALGLEELAARPHERATRRAAALASLAVAAAVGYLLVDSLGVALRGITRQQRLVSLIWPVALAAALLVALALICRAASPARLRRALLGGLVAAQSAFLFTAGVGVPTYGHLYYATTPAIARLQSLVGSSLVGLDNGNTGERLIAGRRYGVRSFGVPNAAGIVLPRAGLYPNVNIGYGIHLFGVHDPLIPAAYFSSWPVPLAAPVAKGVGLFVPAITSASLARRYGIAFILAPTWAAPLAGTHPVALLAGDERLYKVPGAARFTFPNGGEVRSVHDGGDGSFTLTTSTARPSRLILRVSALPGWHLAADGRPLALSTYDGVEQSAVVPAGVHHLELHYFPARLEAGLWLALAGVVALLTAMLLVALAARRRSRRSSFVAPG